MENKQTAMQMLKAHINDDTRLGMIDKKHSDRINWYIDTYFIYREKEQIGDAYCKGVNDFDEFEEGDKINWEKYYSETFKQ